MMRRNRRRLLLRVIAGHGSPVGSVTASIHLAPLLLSPAPWTHLFSLPPAGAARRAWPFPLPYRDTLTVWSAGSLSVYVHILDVQVSVHRIAIAMIRRNGMQLLSHGL